jgi:tetratricopeptide (TPR) repeat protein
MKPSVRTTVIASLLLLAFLAGTVLTLGGVDQIRGSAPLQEVLYISSPKVLKRLSLGYTGLLADIYWTRAVQYFGGKHHAGADEYKLLGPLLEITAALDPHLLPVYEYGANFLSPRQPLGAGEPKRAVELVERGIAENSNNWHLYNNLGFIYYLELHDYKKAAEAFDRGSKVPGAHPFLHTMAANMAEHAGDTQMARMLWVTSFESTESKDIRLNAVAHLRALQVEDDVTALERLVSIYRERTGHLPASLGDLVAAGFLRGIPADPTGRPYKVMPDGSIQVRNPDDVPFLTKGIPPGYKAPPPSFKGLKPEL